VSNVPKKACWERRIIEENFFKARRIPQPCGTYQINPSIYYKYRIVLGTKTVTDLSQSV
jgi:hypothetical protein